MGFFLQEQRDGVLLLSIDRAPLNALTTDLLDEGASFLRSLASDPPAAGLVLTGAGKAFTAGVDTKVAAGLDRPGRRALLNAVNNFAAALYRLPCAVVSAVNGHAIGAGGIMCLASDWTLIADSPAIRIGLPEAAAGLPFPDVPTLILQHSLDPVWRRRLALSSLLLAPVESINAGLADELVAPDRLIALAIERARKLESQPAFRIVKADQRARALAEIAAFLESA
jgi:enoyl-CoA hydratase